MKRGISLSKAEIQFLVLVMTRALVSGRTQEPMHLERHDWEFIPSMITKLLGKYGEAPGPRREGEA